MPGVTSDLEKFITIRDASKQDLGFIRSTWMNGLYYGSDWYQAIPRPLFDRYFPYIMDMVFNRERVWVKLAVITDEPDAIVGYAIGEKDHTFQTDDQTVHFIYVKPAWRSKGVASTLFPEDTKQVTHLTKIGKSILLKKTNAIFNPFKLGEK